MDGNVNRKSRKCHVDDVEHEMEMGVECSPYPPIMR